MGTTAAVDVEPRYQPTEDKLLVVVVSSAIKSENMHGEVESEPKALLVQKEFLENALNHHLEAGKRFQRYSPEEQLH